MAAFVDGPTQGTQQVFGVVVRGEANIIWPKFKRGMDVQIRQSGLWSCQAPDLESRDDLVVELLRGELRGDERWLFLSGCAQNKFSHHPVLETLV